ncbi:unnamed protein product [Lymnaea stagnalis]|uniref:E2F-associated phosphoprotein n=1 Tax=Lymnaea stagnalis TaxID=6523 RepID=A0AAV2H434_LYMST
MSLYASEKGYDLFEDEGDESFSDEDGTSSEDEINIILHGTPEQKRKLQHFHKKQQQSRGNTSGKHESKSSSEDEFEREMNAELNKHVKMLEDSRGKQEIEDKDSLKISESFPALPSNIPVSNAIPETEFYDEIYFDSESDEEDITETKLSKKKKRAVISNDDLLYDPNMDDEDQKWVDRQRNHSQQGGQQGKKSKVPNSDALLDCPACMTTLCLDCQRHETYKHQYRAMFVMNCTVDHSETLEFPEQAQKKKKKKSLEPGKALSSGQHSSKDSFNPVKCNECNTVVGVIDKDEVYHFFNVLASHA